MTSPEYPSYDVNFDLLSEAVPEILVPHEAAMEQFYSVWEGSPDEVVERKNLFDSIAAAVTSSCINTESGTPERLQSSLAIIEWVYCGRYGESLHEGLVLIGRQNDDDTSTFKARGVPMIGDAKIGHAYDDTTHVYEQMVKCGLNTLSDASLASRQERRAEIEQVYRQAIVSSAQVQFFRQFAQTDGAKDERPLTLPEKTARAASLAQEVRQRHGLDEAVDLRQHYGANREFGRKVLHLDDEKVASDDGALDEYDALRQYFAKELFAGYESGSETIEKEIKEYKNGGQITNVYMTIEGQLLRSSPDVMVDVNLKSMISELVVAAFADERPKSINQIIDEACMAATPFAVTKGLDMHDEFLPTKFLASIRGISRTAAKVVWLLNDRLQIPELRFANQVESEPEVAFDSPSIISAESVATAIAYKMQRSNEVTSEIVGRATQELQKKWRMAVFEPFIDTTTSNRLLLNEPLADMPAPANANQPDLRLRFLGTAPAGIVGYRVQAVDTVSGLVEYVKTEHDPYVFANFTIGATEQQRMISAIAILGLPDLTNALSVPGVTVPYLVSTLATYGEYTYDDSLPAVTGNDGLSIKDERLQMQCTGAAKLLEGLLNTAYPGSASAVGGLLVKQAKGVVSGVGHAQVKWIEPSSGNTYYLDATPLFKPNASRPEVSVVNEDWEDGIDYGPALPSLKERLAKMIEPLIGMTGEGMYESLLRLSSEDPVSLTMAAISRAESGIVQPKWYDDGELLNDLIEGTIDRQDPRLEVAGVPLDNPELVRRMALVVGRKKRNRTEWYDDPKRLIGYIDGLSQEDPELLRRAGIRRYTPDTLRMLKSFAQRLLDQPKV